MLLDRTIMNESATETARTGSRTVIGPWAHAKRRRYGNIDFGPAAKIDAVALQICWFDYWLKDKPNGIDKSSLITPGEAVEYTIRMNPTSNAFLPGHRIRLDITSSDFPNYDRNHNTAADQNADAELQMATQTIHHGGTKATRIILPWIAD